MKCNDAAVLLFLINLFIYLFLILLLYLFFVTNILVINILSNTIFVPYGIRLQNTFFLHLHFPPPNALHSLSVSMYRVCRMAQKIASLQSFRS